MIIYVYVDWRTIYLSQSILVLTRHNCNRKRRLQTADNSQSLVKVDIKDQALEGRLLDETMSIGNQSNDETVKQAI